MQELEDILDDDEDMADMYLERRAEQLAAAAASRTASLASAGSTGAGTPGAAGPLAGRREEARVSPHDIEEAENLVESYFTQVVWVDPCTARQLVILLNGTQRVVVLHCTAQRLVVLLNFKKEMVVMVVLCFYGPAPRRPC